LIVIRIKNRNRDLLSKAVKKIQNAGLQVSGGFIVGFDSEYFNCFSNNKSILFSKKSEIVSAMVGDFLNAPKNTETLQ